MPRKTTTDKKDTGKNQNAGKDVDGSKVRCFVSVGVGFGSMGMKQGGGKLKAATSINVRHILCEVGFHPNGLPSPLLIALSRNIQKQPRR